LPQSSIPRGDQSRHRCLEPAAKPAYTGGFAVVNYIESPTATAVPTGGNEQLEDNHADIRSTV
jgi:hypothetical protein